MYQLRVASHEYDPTSHFVAPYIFCKENAERPHTHVFGTLLKSDAQVRKDLNKLGYKGNSGYSLSKMRETPEKNIAYIIKDGNYENVGFSDEVLQNSLEYDQKVKDEISDKKSKGTDHSQVIKLIEATGREMRDTKDVERYVVQYFSDKAKTNQKQFRKYHFCATYDTVCIHFFGQNYLYKVLEKYTKF